MEQATYTPAIASNSKALGKLEGKSLIFKNNLKRAIALAIVNNEVKFSDATEIIRDNFEKGVREETGNRSFKLAAIPGDLRQEAHQARELARLWGFIPTADKNKLLEAEYTADKKASPRPISSILSSAKAAQERAAMNAKAGEETDKANSGKAPDVKPHSIAPQGEAPVKSEAQSALGGKRKAREEISPFVAGMMQLATWLGNKPTMTASERDAFDKLAKAMQAYAASEVPAEAKRKAA